MEIPKPVNTEERYLYAMCEKLDLIVELLSSMRDESGEDVEITKEEFYEKIEEAKKEPIDYESMNKNELVSLLARRGVEFNKRDLKAELIRIAKETE